MSSYTTLSMGEIQTLPCLRRDRLVERELAAVVGDDLGLPCVVAFRASIDAGDSVLAAVEALRRGLLATAEIRARSFFLEASRAAREEAAQARLALAAARAEREERRLTLGVEAHARARAAWEALSEDERAEVRRQNEVEGARMRAHVADQRRTEAELMRAEVVVYVDGSGREYRMAKGAHIASGLSRVPWTERAEYLTSDADPLSGWPVKVLERG